MRIEDTEVSKKANVKVLWRRAQWRLVDPIDTETEHAWEEVRSYRIREDQEDSIHWRVSTSGTYSIAGAWKELIK